MVNIWPAWLLSGARGAEPVPGDDPADAPDLGRTAVTETKIRDRLGFAPLPDEPVDNLPEPLELTAEQIAVQAEAEEQEQRRRLELAMINQALRDNSMAVTRAMSQWWSDPDERERQTDRAVTRFEDGSFLIDRLGAANVIDQDLATVLLQLRRGLIGDYGRSPAALMLIDRAVAAYRDFIQISGWIGNLATRIEHEFFGTKGPSADYRDRRGREGPMVRGLKVEELLARLREGLLPLAERCGRVMREALASLEVLRAAPSEAVERSRPMRISLMLERSDEAVPVDL